MTEKMLWGVAHAIDRPEELKAVMRGILERTPSSVGLELPEDYFDRNPPEYSDPYFFGDIALFSRDNGIKVVPLEDPELWDTSIAITNAYTVVNGHLRRENLERAKEKMKHTVEMFPEKRRMVKGFKRQVTKTLQILGKSAYPSIEALMAMKNDYDGKRNKYMTQSTLSKQPDIVIIGDAHAQAIKGALPGYVYADVYDLFSLGPRPARGLRLFPVDTIMRYRSR